MGRVAEIIAISFTTVCAVAIVFMIVVVRSTRGGRDDGAVDEERLRRTEKTWFVAVVVMLAAFVFATIFFTPYGRTAAANAQVLDVQAQQFAWILPPKPVVAGRQVEFVLTSKDVVHAFAVYSPSGTLLFQAQVTPGATTDYEYTFSKPGVYRVVCLEYCGSGHTQMFTTLTVRA